MEGKTKWGGNFIGDVKREKGLQRGEWEEREKALGGSIGEKRHQNKKESVGIVAT